MEYKFTKWIEKQESYGLMNSPMKAQKAVDMLAYYLDVPPDPSKLTHILLTQFYISIVKHTDKKLNIFKMVNVIYF